MVEVFKTNVKECEHANMLIAQIHLNFPAYKANFDLEDCDKILRVKSTGLVDATRLIRLVKDFGFQAEILEDTVPLAAL